MDEEMDYDELLEELESKEALEAGSSADEALQETSSVETSSTSESVAVSNERVPLEANVEKAQELRKQLDELMEHGRALLTGDDAMMACRSTAITLSQLAEKVELDEKAPAIHDMVHGLHTKADFDTLKAVIGGLDVMSPEETKHLTREECMNVFRALDRDLNLETDLVRDACDAYKLAALQRYNELPKSSTQISEQSEIDDDAVESVDSVSADDTETPWETAELVIIKGEPAKVPLSADDAETEIADVGRPPVVVAPHRRAVEPEDKHPTEDVEHRAQWGRLKTRVFGGPGLLVFIGLVTAIAVFVGWHEDPSSTDKLVATSAEDATTSPRVTETIESPHAAPSIPGRVEPPAPPTTVAPVVENTVVVPETTSEHTPAFTCRPFSETARCSDATRSEEAVDLCATRQMRPRYSRVEHQRFWDCGNVVLDLANDGRQDVCRVDCCFCRYE